MHVAIRRRDARMPKSRAHLTDRYAFSKCVRGMAVTHEVRRHARIDLGACCGCANNPPCGRRIQVAALARPEYESLVRRDKIGVADLLRDLVGLVDRIQNDQYERELQREGKRIAQLKLRGVRIVPGMIRERGRWKRRGEFADIKRRWIVRNTKRPHDGDSPGNIDQVAADLGMTAEALLDDLRS